MGIIFFGGMYLILFTQKINSLKIQKNNVWEQIDSCMTGGDFHSNSIPVSTGSLNLRVDICGKDIVIFWSMCFLNHSSLIIFSVAFWNRFIGVRGVSRVLWKPFSPKFYSASVEIHHTYGISRQFFLPNVWKNVLEEVNIVEQHVHHRLVFGVCFLPFKVPLLRRYNLMLGEGGF